MSKKIGINIKIIIRLINNIGKNIKRVAKIKDMLNKMKEKIIVLLRDSKKITTIKEANNLLEVPEAIIEGGANSEGEVNKERKIEIGQK